MKKVLILILIAILVILSYMIIVNGLKIGGFRILGITDIKASSEELDKQIQQAEILTSKTYQTKIEDLNKSVSDLIKNKQNYQDLISYSTEQEIQQANQYEKYEIEFLWTTIGNHAKEQGVIIKMDFTNSSTGTPNLYDLNFTANGGYIPITDFLYAIESDTALEFKIENFLILPDKDTNNLKATFIVRDIAVNISQIDDTNNVQDNSDNTDNNSDTTDNSINEGSINTTENNT